MAEKVKYKPVPIEQVKQGDWVAVRSPGRVLNGPKPPRYYVQESHRGAFDSHVLRLLECDSPKMQVRKFERDIGFLLLVEVN